MRTPIRAALLTVAILAAVGGCSDDSDPTGTEPQPTVQIRVIHACPDLDPVDVYIEGAAQPWFADLAYGKASTFITGQPATVRIVLREAGAAADAAPLFTSDDVTLASGQRVSAVLAGLFASGDPADSFRMITYLDGFQAHGTDESRVRVVHVGADAPMLTVTVSGGNPLAVNLDRFEDSGPGGQPYPAGDSQHVAVFGDGGAVTFHVPALTLGQDYYFIVTGLTGSAPPAADAFTLVPVGTGGDIDLLAPDPRDLRLVHVAPDAAPVRAYVVQGLGAGLEYVQMQSGPLDYLETTPYVQPAYRDVFVELYPVAVDPTQADPIIRKQIHLADEPSSLTVFAAGLATSADPTDQLRLLDVPDEFADAGAGNYAVRFLHASPDAGSLQVDVGDDSTDEAVLERFAVGPETSLALTAGTAVTVVARLSGTQFAVFDLPDTYPAGQDRYLVFTGLWGGAPVFTMLSLDGTSATEVPYTAFNP